ncbi:glycosyltransferase family 2 protein [Robbsia sp. Bb-Pol-6]|uniref:Glycosyltransferase family 2 protein n=1 Tax=Robbsia betulipollinis TaxID=2981849 RepID=A0ABT3ZIE4_9BURK|nr:glycosyltransferase family 2 protein [Robbsia betulipollinis]MCY0386288.1 glycosyltransferase family 2 protein [Robbsia betulipollinis]
MKLAIVIPCFNEEEVFSESVKQFTALVQRMVDLGKVSDDSHITFVDDGSRDSTWALIDAESRINRRVRGIKLTRNRGHQNAVLAGLLSVDGDAIVTIDADLQDDISAIERMVDEHAAGCDIVYGVRSDRTSDTLFKRQTATSFYRLLALMGIETIHNHADFRLMSRRAVECLREFPESNVYLRGLIPLIGFRSTSVMYERKERFAGESKYPIGKMLALAFEAITSFSTAPLKAISVIGTAIFLLAMVMLGWALWVAILTDRAVPGWTSTLIPVLFLGGMQILILGIIGSYLGKVYGEVKRRPRFQIEKTSRETDSARSTVPTLTTSEIEAFND